MWCDDETIRPFFIEAGRVLTLANMRRQMGDSLVDAPFPTLPESLQTRTFWEFGSAEDHFKFREAVTETWPAGNFPIFEGHNHMQYQIEDPQGFASMLAHIVETGQLPDLPLILVRWSRGCESGGASLFTSLAPPVRIARGDPESALDQVPVYPIDDVVRSVERLAISACTW